MRLNNLLSAHSSASGTSVSASLRCVVSVVVPSSISSAGRRAERFNHFIPFQKGNLAKRKKRTTEQIRCPLTQK
jgi:hypothetical protein